LVTEKVSVRIFILTGPSTSRTRVRCASRAPCLSGTCVGWSEASLQNWRLYRTIATHFEEKDISRFL